MWDTFVVNPMINSLLVLYGLVGNNFFLAIAIFTLAIRLVTLPLSLRQQRSSMRIQEMQPQIQAIQKKYRDNPQKMQEEFAKIGYNPAESLMGCLPLLVQMPILFGLYAGIQLLLSSTPLSLFELVQRVYPFIDLQGLFPLQNQFLWMNLGQPDPLFVLPLLVFATTYFSQRLLMPSPKKKEEDEKKKGKKEEPENPLAGMTQSMQVTMPVMFGFMALSFPAGLSLYFVLSNLIGVGQGLFLRQSMEKEKAANGDTAPPPSSADVAVASSANGQEEVAADGTPARKRKRGKKKRRR